MARILLVATAEAVQIVVFVGNDLLGGIASDDVDDMVDLEVLLDGGAPVQLSKAYWSAIALATSRS